MQFLLSIKTVFPKLGGGVGLLIDVDEQTEKAGKMKYEHYRRMSRIALALILVGFSLQIVSNHWLSITAWIYP